MHVYDQTHGYVTFKELYPNLVLHKVIDDNTHDLYEEENEKTCIVLSVKLVTWYSYWTNENVTENEYHIRFHETGREETVRARNEQAWGWKIQSLPAS